MSCVCLFLQAQQGLTYFTLPAACCLPLKTWSHKQVPYTNTSVQTHSQLHHSACLHVCCLQGQRGTSPPVSVCVDKQQPQSRQPTVNPHPAELVCAVIGSDSRRQFVSTLGAFGQRVIEHCWFFYIIQSPWSLTTYFSLHLD